MPSNVLKIIKIKYIMREARNLILKLSLLFKLIINVSSTHRVRVTQFTFIRKFSRSGVERINAGTRTSVLDRKLIVLDSNLLQFSVP